jgi:hypothetical protein
MEEDLRKELDAVKQTCADLQKELSRLNDFIWTQLRLGHRVDGELHDRLHGVDAAQAEIRDRIFAVEQHCFPGAKKGCEAVTKLIGKPENEDYSRLDYRSRYR